MRHLLDLFFQTFDGTDMKMTDSDIAQLVFLIMLAIPAHHVLVPKMVDILDYFFPKQDAAVRWQMGFQDPATPVAEGIFDFHHELFYVVVFIVFFVGLLLIRCIQLFDSKKNAIPANFVHQTTVEVVWTLTPAYILLLIAVPSFALLYSMDECIDPEITTKALGHQWYWSYEYSDYSTQHGDDFAYDSYMINDDDLKKGQLRLLEVDRRVVFPIKTHIRIITTSADVIHSWAVPSLGAKLDACPGRLNQTSLFIKRPGTFFGQCSEICGVNHGFMPISVIGVSLEEYVHWLEKKGEVLFS